MFLYKPQSPCSHLGAIADRHLHHALRRAFYELTLQCQIPSSCNIMGKYKSNGHMHGGVGAYASLPIEAMMKEDGRDDAVDERQHQQHQREGASQEGAVGQHGYGQDQADGHGQRKVYVLHNLASAWQIK